MTPDIYKIIAIARQAGKAILNVYEQDFEVMEKSDQSPLTQADLASHEIIAGELAILTPDIPVLSEESAVTPFEERSQWQRYWLIDPLDGTREFVKRNGEFTVNIALIDDGKAVAGVVYVPVSDTLYYGEVGVGAYRQDGDAEPKAIRVNTEASLPVKVAGSRSHAGDSLLQFLNNLGEHEIVSMGSSLKLCLVAEGHADIYPRLGPTSEWDTAAAQAVVEAAGGRVTDLKMQPLRYNTKESLLNPFFLVFGDLERNWSQYL
ncbi:MAG: 3'(2'),5'-bisphosphate nucleotidase CysQ [bacterium]